MAGGIGREELASILAGNPRLVGMIRGNVMAGFLSKTELEALVTGSVQTGDIADGAVGAAKIADGAVGKAKLAYKSVAVTVAAAAGNGSSDADSELAGGEIEGCYSTGNQDQLVDSVVLNADGSVTITLAAAATGDNTFNVVVAKP